jgi:hypothetical protein
LVWRNYHKDIKFFPYFVNVTGVLLLTTSEQKEFRHSVSAGDVTTKIAVIWARSNQSGKLGFFHRLG